MATEREDQPKPKPKQPQPESEGQPTPKKSKKAPPYWTKFAVAGLGGTLGWLPCHPFDVTKVRMQINETSLTKTMAIQQLQDSSSAPIKIAKPTIRSTMSSILQTEGFLGLYKGLTAAVTRQMTYTTLRLGLYEVFRERVIKYRNNQLSDSSNSSSNSPNIAKSAENINIWDKLACGLSAGAIAAGLCNPVEVALVRMQADGAQANPKLKRNYKNVFDAWIRVTREEGFLTLYRGVRPTVARGMIVSCVQLASYDHAKTLLSNMIGVDGVALHFSASLISGYLYCLASLPLDICKTRMQNQHKRAKRPNRSQISSNSSFNRGSDSGVTSIKTQGKAAAGDGLMYRTIPQTMFKIIQNEGVLALWKGFLPYFARGGGHTIGMFLCVEQIKKIVDSQYQ